MRFVATIVKQTKIYTQKQRKCIKQPTVNEKKLLEICVDLYLLYITSVSRDHSFYKATGRNYFIN